MIDLGSVRLMWNNGGGFQLWLTTVWSICKEPLNITIHGKILEFNKTHLTCACWYYWFVDT